jgi:hypothetical protein
MFEWILGPGVGKSTTALAFAFTLDWTEWTVTWIHLSRTKVLTFVRFDVGCTKFAYIWSREELEDALKAVAKNQKHIVFLNGYQSEGPDQSYSKGNAINGQTKGNAINGQTKVNEEEDIMYRIEVFTVPLGS